MTSRDATLIGYAVVLALAAGWQLVALRRDPSATFGRLIRWLQRSPAFQVFLFLGWAWLGWHLFARGARR
jgi:hypothetical protein